MCVFFLILEIFFTTACPPSSVAHHSQQLFFEIFQANQLIEEIRLACWWPRNDHRTWGSILSKAAARTSCGDFWGFLGGLWEPSKSIWDLWEWQYGVNFDEEEDFLFDWCQLCYQRRPWVARSAQASCPFQPHDDDRHRHRHRHRHRRHHHGEKDYHSSDHVVIIWLQLMRKSSALYISQSQFEVYIRDDRFQVSPV